MSDVKYIVWHCAATPEGSQVSTAEIRSWHVDGRGWRDIGYHYVIELDGSIHKGRPLDDDHELEAFEVGAHVRGVNSKSVGICYVGGVAADGKTPKDTRTDAQKTALYSLTARLLEQFPGAEVVGHNRFANKACPSFDAAADWAQHRASLQVPPRRPRPVASTSTGKTGIAGLIGTASAGLAAAAENAPAVLEQATNPTLRTVTDALPWAASALAVIAVAAVVLMLVRKAKMEKAA